jgi:hypothetical protein
MSENDSSDNVITPVGPVESGASFGYKNNLTVQLNTENLNINLSGLSALERIASTNPGIAKEIIEASREATQLEAKKYAIGALGASTIALAMIIGFVTAIIFAGLFSGIVFFAVCAAVCALFSAVFTGKSQSLEWTVRLLGNRDQKKD